MQLLVEAADPDEAETALRVVEDCSGPGSGAATERLRAARRIWKANPQAWSVVKAALDGVEHGGAAATPEEGVAHWAALFDRAAAISPEASVALYSLGSAELLDAATDEIVRRMRAWGLLGPGRDMLDIGCGIGRFVAALAPEIGRVTGIDISRRMIDLARQHCAGLANVRLLPCSGRDLAPFAAGSFDLVLAADAFPYLVQSGAALAERHVHEAARVLRPGGTLLILNFSYRGDLDADRREVARLATESGFRVVRDGTRDFALWDGASFQLLKEGLP
jgi:SAM-dependent methyltransferase